MTLKELLGKYDVRITDEKPDEQGKIWETKAEYIDTHGARWGITVQRHDLNLIAVDGNNTKVKYDAHQDVLTELRYPYIDYKTLEDIGNTLVKIGNEMRNSDKPDWRIE